MSTSVFRKSSVFLLVTLLLIVSSANGGRSLAQAEPAVTEYTIPTDDSQPSGITPGPYGTMWFAEGSGDKIGKITMDGQITEYPIPTAGSNPGSLVADKTGAVWFLERFGNKVGRITNFGQQIDEFAIPTGGQQIQTASGQTMSTSLPLDIVNGPDNALWFTEQAGNKIGRVATDGTITEYSVPTANSGPFGIVLGGANLMWFTERTGNKIGSITAGGQIAEYPLPTANAEPALLVTDSAGIVWFSEYKANQIGRITLTGQIKEYPVPGAGPLGITLGDDGALWFTEYNVNKIGRITTDGQMTDYPVKTDKSAPTEIARGPDQAAWFTEQNGNAIGRIQTSPPSPVAFVWRTDGGVNKLGVPSSVVTDSQGNVYVVNGDYSRIQKFDPNGNFITMWGSSGRGDGHFTFRVGAGHVDAMTIDSHDILYVLDAKGYVQKFDTNGKFLGKWGDGYGTADGQFQFPECMAVSPQGDFYIADEGPTSSASDVTSRIQIFDSDGHFLAKWDHSNHSEFGDVSCVAFDPQGNVYVSSYHASQVQKFDSQGKLLTSWGSYGSGDGQFDDIFGIAVDRQGNVYVGDNRGNRVEKFDGNGKFLGKWGSFGVGDGQFNYVFKLTVDKDGNVYVTSDGGDDRLQKFKPVNQS
jgi:virginiamycin B lyase